MKRVPFSKTFKGCPTNFAEMILNGTKIHTFRQTNLRLKEGEMFQPSEWIGRPYHTNMANIGEPLKVVYILRVRIFKDVWIHYRGAILNVKVEDVAKNDGFATSQDFLKWFPREFSGVLIGWAEFPY